MSKECKGLRMLVHKVNELFWKMIVFKKETSCFSILDPYYFVSIRYSSKATCKCPKLRQSQLPSTETTASIVYH